jgi:hypothetical protein
MLTLPIIQSNRVQIRNLLSGRVVASLDRSDAVDVAGDDRYVVVVYRDGSAHRYLAHDLRELGVFSARDIVRCQITDGHVVLYRNKSPIYVYRVDNGVLVKRF